MASRAIHAIIAALAVLMVSSQGLVAETERTLQPGQLEEAIKKHQALVKDPALKSPDPREHEARIKADPRRANFRNARLESVDLSRADLSYADLTGATVRYTKLRGTDLRNADLSESNFDSSDCEGASFRVANLRKAAIFATILTRADFSFADLRDARISSAELGTTQFTGADLSGAVVSVAKADRLQADNWARVKNLSRMRLGGGDDTRVTFIALRDEFKKAGLTEQARQLTVPIRRAEMEQANPIERWFQYVAFDLPVEYGNSPGRALQALLVGIAIFSIFYVYALLPKRDRLKEHDGLWRVWNPDRIRGGPWGGKDREQLVVGLPKAVLYGLYFSILSAFHFGWRDLNVGNWIARIQPNEYVLRPTGWVRVVSGTQSLLSVYLVALWALSYFGRPFE